LDTQVNLVISTINSPQTNYGLNFYSNLSDDVLGINVKMLIANSIL